MTRVLHIDASAHYEESTSRAASAKIVESLTPTTVTRRDLTAEPLPQITGAWADARLVPADAQTADDRALLALSDTLVDEIKAADTIVIGAPIYNFAGPASLKAWMDLVARPKVTFEYTEDGPRGLLNGKTAIVAIASGGVPVGGEVDFLSSHLRVFLGFIGITEVEIRAAKDVIARDS